MDTMTKEGADPKQIRAAIIQGAYKAVPLD